MTERQNKAPAPRSCTLAHFLPGDFRDFKTANLSPQRFPGGAFRVKNGRRPARLASPELKALFPFDQLLLSAGVSGCPFGAEARVKTAGGWSPWFSWGRFEPGKAASAPVKENPFGRMDTDILKLTKKASAFRYRVTLYPAGGKRGLLRCAAVSYTDSLLPYAPPAASPAAPPKPLSLALPRRSQMALPVSYAGDICSPVSLSMVLTAYGAKTSPLVAAAAVRDHAQHIYGNWFFNTAYAGARGFYSMLARLNSLEEARAFIEAGVPVIASVTFGPGELRRSPLKKTKGHLLVIAGFTAKGDVIVHDPAAPGASTVRRVYGRAQFARAWLGNKYGLSYIVAKDLRRFLAVRSGFTELYSRPPRTAAERKKLIETQLVMNERVELLGISGRWARVRAPEQQSLKSHANRLSPYEGWLEAGHIGFSLPQAHTAVVKSKTARTAGAELSIGVKLPHSGELDRKHLHQLPHGQNGAWLRKKVLETARLFLGDKYYWGGRSAWGVDCSGLVNLAYRACGVDLPRNAGDQLAACRRVSPPELRPGDLIFSAAAARPADITHVMLYSGGGRLIEATGDTNSVREVSFKRKFGADFSKASGGMTANGKKIYFGRIVTG